MNGGGGGKQKERKTRERKIAKKKKEKRRFSIDTRYTYTLYLDTIPSRAHRKKTEETRVYYTHTRVYTYTQKGEEKKKKRKKERTYLKNEALHESTCNSKIIVLRTFCDNY